MKNPHKYIAMEHTLEIINGEYISLPPEEVKTNNIILHDLLDEIIKACVNSNKLFAELYQGIYYGGSFYDGLKINRPDEFDIHVKFYIPSSYSHAVLSSNKSGYVHLEFFPTPNNSRKLWNGWRDVKRPYYGMYGLHVLIDDEGYLDTYKVMIWMHQILSTWLGGEKRKKSRVSSINSSYGELEIKLRRHGPAFTFHVTASDGFKFDFDFVPCFLFGKDQWPSGFKRNKISRKCEFYIIPKSKYGTCYWRTSFQEQERDILSGKERLKPALRLIKQVRDTYGLDEIVSFFIKHIFLWEVLHRSKAFWSLPLSYVFMTMLEKMLKCIRKCNIPYFWHEKFNLIGHLDPYTLLEIGDILKDIITDLKTNPGNPVLVAGHFLNDEEMENFSFR